MQLAYMLSGGAPVYVKYQIGETWLAVAGLPVEAPALADVDGVVMCETNECLESVGVTCDLPRANAGNATATSTTRLTAQQTDGTDPQQVVTVCINPNAVYRVRLSGGSTSGTALSAQTNTSASTDGLTITTSSNLSAYDDGAVWGATGANAGKMRKATAVTTTTTLVVAFPYDIAVNDTFYYATFGQKERAGFNLTSNLDEADATADAQSLENFRCISMDAKDAASKGATESYAYVVIMDHVYGGRGANV